MPWKMAVLHLILYIRIKGEVRGGGGLHGIRGVGQGGRRKQNGLDKAKGSNFDIGGSRIAGINST